MLGAIRPDRIYHLAGSFTNEFASDLAANVTAAYHVFEAALALEASPRIVVIGSAAEYGDVLPHGNPLPETALLRPRTIYGLTKAYQTQLAQLYARGKGLPVMVARTFNLFGMGGSPRLFIGHVERQIEALRNGALARIAVGDLNDKRDYLDVDAACAAYHRIMERGTPGEVYNVASGHPIALRDVLRRVLENAGLDESSVSEARGEQRSVGSCSTVVYADVSKLRALGDG